MPITYDKKINEYRDANNKIISRYFIRREIEKAVGKTSKLMRETAKRYNKTGNLAQFQIEMAQLVKSLNILTASIANGGYKQMTAKSWGKTGAKIKKQYGYLNNFIRDIEKGKVSSIQIENRASLYANQSRAGFFQAEMNVAIDAGLTEARRTQNSKEGCSECSHYASVGWIPIEEMPGIGELSCGQFCLCEIEYK